MLLNKQGRCIVYSSRPLFLRSSWLTAMDSLIPNSGIVYKTKYGKDGVLWAANSDESADRMMSLLGNCKRKIVKSGHDIHFEKPWYFFKAMKILEKMIK